MALTTFKKQIRFLLFLVYGLWAFMIVSSGMDIYSDIRFHATWRHILTESATLIACVTSALLLMYYFSKITTLTIQGVESTLKSNELEASSLKNKNKQLMQGLSENIQLQFRLWELSKAEAEIAILLIKGFSLKEIADLRITSERTVREQARKLYKKANLAGRSELSAYFLEDLLLLPD